MAMFYKLKLCNNVQQTMSHIVLQLSFIGLPSFAPAISFLQGAGQGHIVNQVNKTFC